MRNEILILGLGSNLNSPITQLRLALEKIRKHPQFKILAVSGVFESEAQVPEGRMATANPPYLNAAVAVQMNVDVQEQDLVGLLQKIELDMGRQRQEKWESRCIDVDILFASKVLPVTADLEVPHPRLLQRPFALEPLVEVIHKLKNRWHGSAQAPIISKLVQMWTEFKKIQSGTGHWPSWDQPWVESKPFSTVRSQSYFWPEIFGILNVTPDSFSDGGRHDTAEKIYSAVEKMLLGGAAGIDIGAESTRPEAALVTEEAETLRLTGAFSVLAELKKKYDFKISVDCRRPKILRRLKDNYDFDFVNDVSGLTDPQMKAFVRDSKLKCIAMHSLSVPADRNILMPDKTDPVDLVNKWGLEKISELTEFGISLDQISLDIGLGFGKTRKQNLHLLNHLSEIQRLWNVSVMIGLSRKSFLTLFTDREAHQRDLETALVTAQLEPKDYQYLRVHDVKSQALALSFSSYRDSFNQDLN